MELPADSMIPFIGMEQKLKPVFTESRPKTSLFMYVESHVDKRCKSGLLKTMLHRACAPACTTEARNEECAKLHPTFSRIDYPIGVINYAINIFIQNIAAKAEKKPDDGNTIRIVQRTENREQSGSISAKFFV